MAFNPKVVSSPTLLRASPYHARMSEPVLDSAIAHLRGHARGELRFDEHLLPLKYVVDPQGRIIAPAMVAMLQAADTVLFVPTWNDEAMEVQTTLEQFQDRGPDGAAADRWRIYHGEPEDVNWAILHVDAVRFQQSIIDGEAMLIPNPLASDEAAICREWNQRRDDLRALAQRLGGMDIEEPVMVGLDPFGCDIRARFDIVRVKFASFVHDADEARQMLDSL